MNGDTSTGQKRPVPAHPVQKRPDQENRACHDVFHRLFHRIGGLWALPPTSEKWITTREDFIASNANYRAIMAELERQYRFRRIDLGSRLCPDRLCRTESEGRSLYMDANHLSVDGALFVMPLFTDIFAPPPQARDAKGQRETGP